MYYFKKLWYKYNEVKRMKIIMALFLFVLILIGLFTMIGVIFLKAVKIIMNIINTVVINQLIRKIKLLSLKAKWCVIPLYRNI